MNLEGKVAEYMKKDPLIVKPEASLREVASLMAGEGKDVVVVRDEEGVVRGLVTASDLFGAMTSYVLGKDLLEQIPRDIRDVQVQEILRRTKTEEFMEVCGLSGAKLCISLWEDDTVANAIRVMAIGGVDHILILGEGGVVGTLSDNDLVRIFTT